MSLSKFLDPKNDFAFKLIFGTEKNKDILIHFLNDMLGLKGKRKIKEVTFLKTIQDPEIASKKQSLIDVLCVDQRGARYIVEMQIAKTAGFVKRAQYYAARVYSGQLNGGDQYPQLKEVIFLAITDFVMFPDKPEYKSDHVILDKISHERDLKDFSFTFLELPKFNKPIDELKTMVEKWAYFFKHANHTSEAELPEIVGKDQVLGRAYEALNQFNFSEIERNTYEEVVKRDRDAEAILEAAKEDGLAAGRAQGMAQGKAEGKVEGEQEARLAIARKLLSNGLSIEAIANITSLDIQAVQLLAGHK